MKSSVRVVVFDVFGTLAEIRTKHRPFVALLDAARRAGYDVTAKGADYVMSHNTDLLQLASECGLSIAEPAVLQLNDRLREELASINLFAETEHVLLRLKAEGYKVALCSNLAAPYGPPVKNLLPYELDAYSWSYEVGAVKPNPAIYRHLVNSLQCTPQEILFVGDTYAADYVGPTEFGFNALHLDRRGAVKDEYTIHSLTEVLSRLEKHET